MDAYASKLMALGLKGMIGKGGRLRAPSARRCSSMAASTSARSAGAGALLSKYIRERGGRGLRGFGYGKRFDAWLSRISPGIVINDVYGNDLYEDGRRTYAR